jgi:hypothetical protein
MCGPLRSVQILAAAREGRPKIAAADQVAAEIARLLDGGEVLSRKEAFSRPGQVVR